MIRLIEKYLKKLSAQGLAKREDVIFLALDAELFSNRPIDDEVRRLSEVFELMNINALLFSRPSEPYWSIINELIEGRDRIVPMDCETRTFFHEIPIIDDLTPRAISEALSKRKSAIVRNKGIVTYGTVSPEQAFVSFSSTCFSTFVKYFYDSLLQFEDHYLKGLPLAKNSLLNFKKIISLLQHQYPPSALNIKPLITSRPGSEDDVIRMLAEAGRAVIDARLVDSYFGNISYIYKDKIYISQTGSSMDELECCIDAVPLNGSSSVGITASSELSAHRNIYYVTGDNAILHGHPRFSVIMSMYCQRRDCDHYRDMEYCYRYCRQKRYVAGVPVVSGEIGTGPTGLVKTVPEAMREGRGVIVFGHGVFTSGRDNFQRPFNRLWEIEKNCKRAYFELLKNQGLSSNVLKYEDL